MKKLTLLSAILSISFLSSTAYAADYTAEIFANYGQTSFDGLSDEASEYSLGGVYYFSGVDAKNHPLAEAAFLERSSNVYVDWMKNEFNDLSGDVARIGVDFYIPDSILFVGAGVARVNVDDGFGDDNDSSWFAKLGVTPVDGLLVWSGFSEDLDISEYWNINAKYVVPLAGEAALNLEAGYEDWDNGDNATHIAADFYFNRSFSLGAGYASNDYDDGFDLRTRYFFNESFSVQASLTSSDEEDGWLVGASVRF